MLQKHHIHPTAKGILGTRTPQLGDDVGQPVAGSVADHRRVSAEVGVEDHMLAPLAAQYPKNLRYCIIMYCGLSQGRENSLPLTF